MTNHLWQSTLFAALVALANLLLRRNSAALRHALWLTASVKFLVPFSLLVTLGTQVETRVVPSAVKATVVEQITTSFAPLPAPRETPARLPLTAIWLTGSGLLLAHWLRHWFILVQARRQATPLPLAAPIPVLSSSNAIEPGVFGFFRPVLLLPEGITSRLASEELDAIVAHELAHVRRHDNLAAALHMLVQAVFWFHPLVWWIGAKLVEEREQACDEAVLADGSRAQVYAQGIVNVCKFYVESPLTCAAGVSGANLRKRIEMIMSERNPLRLTMARLSLLAVAGLAALSLPVLIGILRAQTLPPPPKYKFEVATIRPGDPASQMVRIGPGPQGGLRIENMSVLQLIAFAYDQRDFQITGGPAWIRSERYTINGTPDQAEDSPGPNAPRGPMEGRFERDRQRVQSLLAERFGLVLRADTKELPVYVLSIGKGGSKVATAPEGNRGPNLRVQRGRVTASGATVDMFVRSLANMLGRPILDETGMKGHYDFNLEWTPDGAPGEAAPADASGPSVFTAIQEQLGLKLEPKKAPVSVLIVEKIDKPSEN
ncbi:MAG: TIGR03435 family protein [Bryobacteraceae bacterium]|nr:TIGR03435 family protein [Bryobacteraceae bacterium]